MREKLLIHRDIKFYENIDYLSGINTLTMRKSDKKHYMNFLLKKILTSISSKQSSINYFRNKKLREVLRVSFHYYNTFKEIDYFCDCIANFIDVNK